jgi:acylphosphatase
MPFFMPTVHLLIKGRVQGVFYRASAKEVADKLNLTGWIKNTAEGHVEATVTGNEQVLQQFIQWCEKGPQRAVVTEVAVNSVPDVFFTSFSIARE